VIAAQAAAQAQLAALKGQLGSSAARALVNLGDMSLAGQVGDLALPDETGRLVEQGNTAGTSILSRLGYQHGLNQESIPASLAGRGFYRSGQTGYSLGQEEKQYGTQQYDARSSTLDYLNGLYSNYLNAQFGIQQQEMAAEFAAYQAALANAGAYVQPTGTTATQTQAPAPAPTSAYGYDANGNPVDFSSLWGDPSQGIYV
jgi:hypothetical protein